MAEVIDNTKNQIHSNKCTKPKRRPLLFACHFVGHFPLQMFLNSSLATIRGFFFIFLSQYSLVFSVSLCSWKCDRDKNVRLRNIRVRWTGEKRPLYSYVSALHRCTIIATTAVWRSDASSFKGCLIRHSLANLQFIAQLNELFSWTEIRLNGSWSGGFNKDEGNYC